MFAYPKAQEIEPVLDVRDAGLFCGERQTTLVEKLFDQRLDFLFEKFFRASRNDEVVTIPHQIHFRCLSSPGGLGVVMVEKLF